MTRFIVFDPLIPWPVLVSVAALMILGVGLALWRGLSGWALRFLAGVVLLGALAGPAFQQEDRNPLTDIVVLLEDKSASQSLSDRRAQTEEAATALISAIAARENTELRRVIVPDGDGDCGTALMTALNDTLAEQPRARIAGIIALSDGQVHDITRAPNLPAPMHLLLSGRQPDWDRRLIVRNAPAFAIIGEPVTLTLRIEDSGAVPQGDAFASLDISVDGAPPQTLAVRDGSSARAWSRRALLVGALSIMSCAWMMPSKKSRKRAPSKSRPMPIFSCTRMKPRTSLES